MKTGVVVPLNGEPEKEFAKAASMGFASCQLIGWNHSLMTKENAVRVKAASEASGVEISAFWCGWSGPAAWNFIEGPTTLGIVPIRYRYQRVKELIHGGEFARMLGVTDLITHMGFIPEIPSDPAYTSVVAIVRTLLAKLHSMGINLLFETGQETPTTLLRLFEDAGFPNVGINLDTANLILYGKGNPADAVDVIGKYVRGVHAKDGFYPTTGRALGRECALGEGRVDFHEVLRRLKAAGYDGTLTIEREISGPQQEADIRKAKEFLENIIAGLS